MKNIKSAIREILNENDSNMKIFKFNTLDHNGSFVFNIKNEVLDEYQLDLDVEFGVLVKESKNLYAYSLDLEVDIKKVLGVIKYKEDRNSDEEKELKIDSNKSNVEIINEISISKSKVNQNQVVVIDYIEVNYDIKNDYIEIKFL